MSFRFENLDERTRQYMLEEMQLDMTEGRLYVSPRLSDCGARDYPYLLRSAIQGGSVETFAVHNPRAESVALVGQQIRADQLLHDLRLHIGVDTAFKLPAGPNSGLTVRLPQR